MKKTQKQTKGLRRDVIEYILKISREEFRAVPVKEAVDADLSEGKSKTDFLRTIRIIKLWRNLTFYSVSKPVALRPPINAEYLLYLLLKRDERESVVGDLIEDYYLVLGRFNKKWRADFWFYKQVIASIWPLLRRSVLRIGALVWLGRILRRFIT